MCYTREHIQPYALKYWGKYKSNYGVQNQAECLISQSNAGTFKLNHLLQCDLN